MQNARINTNGLEQIAAALGRLHKLGRDHFTPAMLSAWASAAEDSYAAGNGAEFEIKGRDSTTGRPELVTITPEGYELEEEKTAAQADNSATAPKGEKMAQIWLSNYINDNTKSHEDIVDYINKGGSAEGMQGIEFTAEQLAGQYAYNATKEAGHGLAAENFESQLYYLTEAGAVFDESKATAHAQAIAHSVSEEIMAEIGARIAALPSEYGDEELTDLAESFEVDFYRAANGWEVRKGADILGVVPCEIPRGLNWWKSV